MAPRRYRNHSHLFMVALIAYVLFSNVFKSVGASGAEVFPFFNWSLFTNAAVQQRYNHAIFIEKLDGEVLSPPVLASQLKGRLRIRGSTNIYKATNVFASAIRRKDEKTIRKIRKTIERTYLARAKRLTYSVRLVTYEPLQRYRTGKVSWIENLGSFEVSE